MKKTLIAGAASFALAAMPVIGVFAADPQPVVDTLTVTVAESCAMSRSGGGDYEQTMLANRLNDQFGESVITTECNNGLGYTITASFDDLTHSASAGVAIAYDNATPTAGSGTYTAYSAQKAGGAGNLTDGGYLANTSSQDPTGGSSYTITYKVSTHETQAAGTYSGEATYTLAQKTSGGN